MEFAAIHHDMDKRYCFALSKGKFLIRIKTKKDDMSKVVLHYKDKYLPIRFVDTRQSVEMKKVATDRFSDYYEAVINMDVICLRYFFELVDTEGLTKYYCNYFFYDYKMEDNDRMFDCPQNLREEEMFDIPDWAKNKVVYQIFPSRFATDKEISDEEWYKTPVTPFDDLKGNLRGIINRLDYIADLGIEVIYMTPIFKSKSTHKYNTEDYYEIDPDFGTKEDFRELVEKAHALGMKVVLDAVFNHSGTDFFAFKDVVANGENSKYKEWYYIDGFPLKMVPRQRPNFLCFAYYYGMPKLNLKNPETEEYFINVGKYWIKEFNVDGWRLDVGDEVTHDFWKKFRTAIRGIKRDALIIGEIWHYAGDFLQGDEWDTVMNYQFYLSMIDFVVDERITATEFLGDLGFMRGNLHPDCYKTLLNLIDSHDTPRFKHFVKDNDKKHRLAAAIQLLTPGMPMIYYGDELGMTGALDPDCRRGMLWDEERQNKETYDWYKSLINIRRNHQAVTAGEVIDSRTDDENGLIIETRRYGEDEVTIIFHGKKKIAELKEYKGRINLINGKVFDGKVRAYEALVLQ